MVILLFVFAFSIFGCGSSTTSTTTETISVPEFEDSPIGRLEEEMFWFSVKADQKNLMHLSQTTGTEYRESDGTVYRSLSVDIDVKMNLDSGYVESTMSGKTIETVTQVTKEVNGYQVLLRISGNGVTTELIDSRNADELIWSDDGGFSPEDFPSATKISESDGEFVITMTAYTIFLFQPLKDLMDAMGLTPADMVKETVTITLRFSEDHKTYWETLDFDFPAEIKGTDYDGSFSISLEATVPDSLTMTDLSGYTFYEPRDKELAVPLDLRGSSADRILPVALENVGETEWLAFILDPGFYVFTSSDGSELPNSTLHDTSSIGGYHPAMAFIRSEGTYFLGIQVLTGYTAPVAVHAFQYPADQVGTPDHPIYYSLTGDAVTGQVTSDTPRYLMLEPVEGKTLYLTVTVTSFTGNVRFSVWTESRALYPGRTMTFQGVSSCPMICGITGDGTYSLDFVLSYR